MICILLARIYPCDMVVNGLGNLGGIVLIITIKGSDLEKNNIKCSKLCFFLNSWLTNPIKGSCTYWFAGLFIWAAGFQALYSIQVM